MKSPKIVASLSVLLLVAQLVNVSPALADRGRGQDPHRREPERREPGREPERRGAPQGGTPYLAPNANPPVTFQPRAPQYAPGAAIQPRRPVVFTPHEQPRVNSARTHFENHIATDARITARMGEFSVRFGRVSSPVYDRRARELSPNFELYSRLQHERSGHLEAWHNHRFFGGFHFGFRPCPDIHVAFGYPMVHLFYDSTWDDYYYQRWYGEAYVAYPVELRRPFPYAGIFFPTEDMKNLLISVSGTKLDTQLRFRASSEELARDIAQSIADSLRRRVRLVRGDISVTHYEWLAGDSAILLDGFTQFEGRSHSFKGLLDLRNPRPSADVFVTASWDQNPTSDQLRDLDLINAKIDQITGGVTAYPNSVIAVPQDGAVEATPQGYTPYPGR